MARGGMRVGEVLKLRLKDLLDRKLIRIDPKFDIRSDGILPLHHLARNFFYISGL
jgi:integrase